jgi:propanediol dehydratase small subunit
MANKYKSVSQRQQDWMLKRTKAGLIQLDKKQLPEALKSVSPVKPVKEVKKVVVQVVEEKAEVIEDAKTSSLETSFERSVEIHESDPNTESESTNEIIDNVD